MALLPVCREHMERRAPALMTLQVPLPTETVYSKPGFQLAGVQLDKPTESAFLTMAPFSQCSMDQELQATVCYPPFF